MEGLEQGLQQGLQQGLERGREQGREEGREQGLLQGQKIGMIHLCEQMLNRPQTPTEQLARLSREDLTRLAEKLQAELLKQP